MAELLTDEEKMTLKTGGFGAVFLVANADPGFFALLKESFAASGALADTSGLVKDVLTRGPLPELPKDSPAAVEAAVVPALRESVAILRAKAPEELDNYRSAVLAAAGQVASAARGVTEAENAMMTKVKDVLETGA